MALVKRGGGFLGKSELRIDWNDKALVEKIDSEINEIVRIGAKAVEALARSMVPVDTGALKSSIKAYPSKYEKVGILSRRAYAEWVISAGDDSNINYAAHVELGKYFKDTNTRVPAVPFIRRPLSIMRRKLRALFKNRLKRILD